MIHSPKVIANYLIRKSFADQSLVTPMKLIKLIYIAHGWSLALRDNALINEPIEAWKYGPVISSIYHSLKKYGKSPVTSEILDNSNIDEELSEDEKALLDKVWNVYKPYSGLHLSTLTHQKDSPWDLIFNNGGSEIPNELIKSHYQAKANT